MGWLSIPCFVHPCKATLALGNLSLFQPGCCLCPGAVSLHCTWGWGGAMGQPGDLPRWGGTHSRQVPGCSGLACVWHRICSSQEQCWAGQGPQGGTSRRDAALAWSQVAEQQLPSWNVSPPLPYPTWLCLLWICLAFSPLFWALSVISFVTSPRFGFIDQSQQPILINHLIQVFLIQEQEAKFKNKISTSDVFAWMKQMDACKHYWWGYELLQPSQGTDIEWNTFQTLERLGIP